MAIGLEMPHGATVYASLDQTIFCTMILSNLCVSLNHPEHTPAVYTEHAVCTAQHQVTEHQPDRAEA